MYKYVKSVMGDAIILATIDGVTEMTTMDEIDSIKDPIVGYNRITKKIRVSTVEDVIAQAQAREKLSGIKPTFLVERVERKTWVGEYAEINAVKTGECEYDFIITARNRITTKCILTSRTIQNIAEALFKKEGTMIYCTLVYDLKDITFFNFYNEGIRYYDGLKLAGIRFINVDWSNVTTIGTLLNITGFLNKLEDIITPDFSQLYLPNLRKIDSLVFTTTYQEVYVSDIKFPECPNLSAESFKCSAFIKTYYTDIGSIYNFVEFNNKIKSRLGFSWLKFKSGICKLAYTDYEKLRKQFEPIGIQTDTIRMFIIDKDFTETGDLVKQVHKPTEKERASRMFTDLLSFFELINPYYISLYFTKDFDIAISEDYLQIDVEELWSKVFYEMPYTGNIIDTANLLVKLDKYLEERNISKADYVQLLNQLSYISEGKKLLGKISERSAMRPIKIFYDKEIEEDKPKFKKFITFIFILHFICAFHNSVTAFKVECKVDA